jgi:hypothetical protein
MYTQEPNANPCGWLAVIALLGVGLGVTFACYLSNPKLIMQGT